MLRATALKAILGFPLLRAPPHRLGISISDYRGGVDGVVVTGRIVVQGVLIDPGRVYTIEEWGVVGKREHWRIHARCWAAKALSGFAPNELTRRKALWGVAVGRWLGPTSR